MVRVLALETATQPGSVALLDHAAVRWETSLPAMRRTTQSLLSTVADSLQQVGWRTSDVQLVAVCRGPGSFTGLRIGITVAKLWAYASPTAVVAVNTLQLMAYQANLDDPSEPEIGAVLDAQRGQWFASRIPRSQVADCCAPNVKLVEPQSWLATLPDRVLLTGTGLASLPPAALQRYAVAPERRWSPGAGELGRLAVHRFQLGQQEDIWSLVPHYHRPSAAEEKREASGKGAAKRESRVAHTEPQSGA